SRDKRSNNEEAQPFAPAFDVDKREDSTYAHCGDETMSVNQRQQAGDEASGKHAACRPRAKSKEQRVALCLGRYGAVAFGFLLLTLSAWLFALCASHRLPPLREHNHGQRNAQQEASLWHEETRHRISPAPTL